MPIQIVALPTTSGYFKPEDYFDAAALLVEVREFEANRPGGNFGPKDSALCNVTVFSTQEELDNGTPSQVLDGTRIEGKGMASDLKGLVGSATVAVVREIPSKKPGYKPTRVFRAVDRATQDKVVAYAQKRDAEFEAALADVPSFD